MINERSRRSVLILSLSLAAATFAGTALTQERQASQEETAKVLEILDVGPGGVIADIGAGYGGWTVEVARKVGPTGQIFATEVDSKRLKDIRERVTEAGLTNVTVVWGSQKDTGLPPGCCDAILLRRVYHHFTYPDAMRESIARALGQDGLLAIVDFDPRGWRRPDGIPENRTGHGITKEMLIDEMRLAGFELVQEADSWPGRDYCIVFRAKSASGTEP